MNRPLPPAAADERAIDQSLAQWVLGRTGSALLAAAVRAASRAEGHGHSCAALADPDTGADLDADALEALRRHDWVGNGTAFTPFVLDAQGRFYLWRNWQHETKLAEAILRRCAQRTLPIPADTLADDLATLFAGMPRGATDGQRAAVAAVPGARFFVLTGGPGTGKTTTVVRMLLMLLRHAHACGLSAWPSIALAAPTGKAAQRLAQAVAKGKAELQASLPGSGFHDLVPHIPHAEARTLHRLLGYRPMDDSFGHGPHNPLAEDIVVVDEASMVDLAMMRQLLQALRPAAVLILLGDPGQLASVDAGSVLADIVAAAPRQRLPPPLAGLLAPLLQQAPDVAAGDAPLAGQVLALTHSWRAGSGLQRGVEALRDAPDPAWLDALLDQRRDGDLHLRHCPTVHAMRACVDGWIERHAGLLQSLLAPAIDAAEALQRLRQLQILCALRDGPFGAQGINELVLRRLAVRFGIDASRAWYHGRPVIVTRNDYARGLFNGDVGIALEGAEGLRVWFELSDRDDNAGLRSYSPRALPAHDSAWAITIHRSQGSEYREVAVLLPPDADNRILTRELVYTAISRAKEHAEIWSTDDALRAALARPIRRQGGLRERLQPLETQ
ncbi:MULTISPECIES: exodeoxyribonuclease V subunit alpha [Rhodanobacter]|uniref:exodeoxyribonuclease V subunit alpha n=1 Tax=Rhodanobacter TaxID=75309 RepID=UPI000407D11A|nr:MULTISPECIES: exodeoxyribonuclease V subunit alpha [Rhodanobacter]KZC19788.1 exodeoxyribonuclease V subunit alpha [Rhodanobacter denitrificans]UJJ52298.1 exodeoxyribonuclease V subunit alpha [Rhodanobacter denitrificans]UJM95044.1 exodeoxyribonuclease V subunit alpha [Rhodanobacter denitrificans]UJM98575.1 exodeoxyribonuclease V subunit alpha [Rhodanobacter denitrificans]UJN22011.1 exodeoxyribonuclease V subunit alpha [Rhodanobacter denitrificans]